MKLAHLLLFFLITFSFSVSGKNYAKSTNRINTFGKRDGYWYLNTNNRPVSNTDHSKACEGRYLNGRKEGVWIYYYENTKSPRLIGEYADNRPSGTYFRFNKQGKMFIASANLHSLKSSNRISRSNQIYSCELNFEDQEIVAGQVFFTSELFRKNSYKFWVSKSFESSNSHSSMIDFSWLHNSYNAIYASFLDARKPSSELKDDKSKSFDETAKLRKNNILNPPIVKTPLVADGLEFKPNGLNKLFTKNEELWMDGYFKKGQLMDGKVFIYDNDGVLLKVRVYKKGEYFSDGGL